jgi:3-oxoacyl-[acyl-carrier protein] reductase
MILKGKVAVVTGAGSGIGRAIAIAFAREGARVALAGRREHKLRETAAMCDGETLIVSSNISREDDVLLLRSSVLEKYGRCDILVNNAGIFKPEPGVPLHEAPVEDWDEVMQTNARGPFLCLRAFAPIMIKHRYGRIINITSGLKHAPGHGVYSMSKSALDSLTKTSAQELSQYNVLVNALNPGWVRTEMATNATERPDKVTPLALRLASLSDDEPSGVEYQA